MIDLERNGDVFLLRMTGGENRLGEALLDRLHQVLDQVEKSEGDAALVTTGEGKFYSNGLDLAGLSGAGVDEVEAVLGKLHELFARLLAFPVATVAAINGHAFAAGAMLALAQDFRIMRTGRGFVCLPEIDLATGQPLTPGMYALLDARLSRAAFHEALVSGRRYPAEQALTRGLVDEALPQERVLPRAMELARELAGKDRATLAALKRGLFASALEALGRPLADAPAQRR